MLRIHRFFQITCLFISFLLITNQGLSQNLPPRYATLELFTNTPCPICASQNPGLFNRLMNYDGQYHLVSFYPGKPYSSCIFYQANIPENAARYQYYSGNIFGTPTVAINGVDFKNSAGVTNAVLDAITGNTSWLQVKVEETPANNRTVDITLQDHVGNSISTGRLYAVIVEKEIIYSAPNGETMHHNVFRKFLTPVAGVDVDMSSGSATKTYSYTVDAAWQADQVYVIAWLADPTTKEIFNSGTRFDADFTSAVNNLQKEIELNIYPNPASSEFQIALPEGIKDPHVRIFDVGGKQIFDTVSAGQSQIRIDCSAWPEGIYLAKVIAGSKEFKGRIQVVR